MPTALISSNASSSPSTSQDAEKGYLLGHSEAEMQRLLHQAHVMEHDVARFLDAIGPIRNGSAVDFGCGPIGILPELARHVGPNGTVAGVDVEPSMIERARIECRRRGLTNLALVGGEDVMGALPAGAFDLAHARMVLINVADPAAVLAELVRLVRPGGVVAVQEFDWSTTECDPTNSAWQRLKELLAGLWSSRTFDPYLGRRLPTLLSEAGLVDVRAMSRAAVDANDEPYQRLAVDMAERFETELVSLGLTSRTELRRAIEEASAHLARAGTTVRRPLMVQAWGRVPTGSASIRVASTWPRFRRIPVTSVQAGRRNLVMAHVVRYH